MRNPFILIILSVSLSTTAIAREVTRYTSGKLRLFSRPSHTDVPLQERMRPSVAIDGFLNEFFPERNTQWTWEPTRTHEVNTHEHHRFELRYQGVRVLDTYLDIHYNRAGFVDYATSGWERDYLLNEVHSIKKEEQIKYSYEKKLLDQFSDANVEVEIEPVIFLTPQKAHLAYELKLFHRTPLWVRNLIVDEETERVLEEKAVWRSAAEDIYQIHPNRSSLEDGDITNLSSSGSALSSGYLSSKRDELDGGVGPSVNKLNVDYTDDFSGDSSGSFQFSANPSGSGYGFSCDEGASPACPNQSFDAINVFHHAETYRRQLETYFTQLGLSPSFPNDPLAATVNTLSIDLDGDGVGTDETNNAFYLNVTILGTQIIGLYFLRPDAETLTQCGGSTTFYSLAREALVIVHEYQHYITDMITGMVRGSASAPNVADALHEGYSDYFGASQISRVAGEQVSLVGEYGFPSCSGFRRQVDQIAVFEDGSDSHDTGLFFANGLWQLREDLGVSAADKLAIKSLFFLPANPGYLEAVEALVKADDVLNAGANKSRIRTLFYDTIKFTGSKKAIFEDSTEGVVNLGFKSCLSVPVLGGSFTPGASGVLFLFWMVLSLLFGRVVIRERY